MEWATDVLVSFVVMLRGHCRPLSRAKLLSISTLQGLTPQKALCFRLLRSLALHSNVFHTTEPKMVGAGVYFTFASGSHYVA